MKWLAGLFRWGHTIIALPAVLTAFLAVDIFAYFAGLLFWYGDVMSKPEVPMWSWPFIPDCPLFGFIGGLGFLTVTAHQFWSKAAQERTHRILQIATLLSVLIWLSTYLPGVPTSWANQASMWGVWTLVLLVYTLWFRQAPAWLLGLSALGQIKYGIWTVQVWILYWQATAAFYGTPDFNGISLLMTASHIGLIAQGVILLTYFKLDWKAVLVSFVWFGLSDYMDYWQGYHPAVYPFTPLEIVKWTTIGITLGMTVLYLLLSAQKTVAPTATLTPNLARRSA